MDSIPKFLASLITIFMGLLICISLIISAVTVTSARTYHSSVIDQIEASDFNEAVITACKTAATEKNYGLAVEPVTNESGYSYYKVTLMYGLYAPLFGKIHTGTIIGYAFPGAHLSGGNASGDSGEDDWWYWEIDADGVLCIKPECRWITHNEDYASDNGATSAGSEFARFEEAIAETGIVVPEYFKGIKVTALRDYAFAGYTGLTKVSFEDSSQIQKIGNNVFQNCTELAGTVTLPDTVTTIGSYTFDNCAQLNSIDFGNALKTVGDYAFQNCVKFTDVVMPDSMTKNGYAAFKGCNNMTSYKAPFAGGEILDSDHSYIGYLFGVEVDDYSYKENNTVVPTTLTKVELTKYVAYYSLYDLDSLTELIIGEDVTEFEPWPFAYCDNLTTVTIPKNVTKTSYGAFSNCKGLKTVVFEAGSQMTHLGNSNFEDCSKLTTIELPSTIKTIGAYCFENCDALTFSSAQTGKLPEGVKTIENGAYKDSDGYTTFVIPASVTTIEPHAFTRCKSLEYLQVATGSESFCIGVAGELLTKDKSEIVAYPYAGPTSYTIPSTVTLIREDAFWYSENLLSVDFSKATKLKIIDDSAFSQCPDIESSIVLPDSVTTIGTYAFYHTGKWREFWIGPNVTKIGTYAFYDAGGSACKTYMLMTTAPTIASNVFFTNTTSGTITKNYIYVKNDTVKAALVDGTHYRSAYTNIVVDSTIS